MTTTAAEESTSIMPDDEITVLKSVYNKNNTLITPEAIQKFLAKGGIKRKPNNMELWQKAFIHKSYCRNRKKNYMFDKLLNKSPTGSEGDGSEEIDFDPAQAIPLYDDSNERLEWLGDGIIQSITAQYLSKRYPDQDEGFLTKTRSKLVKTETLCKLAKCLGLDQYVLMSRDVEKHFNGRNNSRILEDTFEAFVGVLSQDFGEDIGYKLCKKFVITVMEYYIDMPELIHRDTNYKDRLMRYYQKEFKGKYPIYNLTSMEGPPNNRTYTMYVTSPSGVKVGEGTGKSKKEAEQNSAKQALQHFGIL